jgi:hypothetical protein
MEVGTERNSEHRGLPRFSVQLLLGPQYRYMDPADVLSGAGTQVMGGVLRLSAPALCTFP